MADKKRTWANRQILWGWAFLIAMTLFLLYLLFAIWLPRMGGDGATAGDEPPTLGVTVIPVANGLPPVKATALVQAQATLAVAAEEPIQAASDVRAAAQTVLAVTAESFETPAVEATPASPTGEPTGGAASADSEDLPGLGWVDWVLGALPGFTAILTFVGLLFTSIMKWRDDLQDFGRDEVDYERQRLQFEMQKQRFEMDRMHQQALLEQQRMELQLERKRLEIERLRQETVQQQKPDPEQPNISDDASPATAA